jgi:rod shape-determining protein MreB
VQTIIDAIKNTLERTPPELAADVSERGILLAGGGALLQGFPERVRDETGMPAQLADSPLTCVAIGSGQSLEEYDTMSRLGGPFQAPPARARRLRARASRAG